MVQYTGNCLSGQIINSFSLRLSLCRLEAVAKRWASAIDPYFSCQETVQFSTVAVFLHCQSLDCPNRLFFWLVAKWWYPDSSRSGRKLSVKLSGFTVPSSFLDITSHWAIICQSGQRCSDGAWSDGRCWLVAGLMISSSSLLIITPRHLSEPGKLHLQNPTAAIQIAEQLINGLDKLCGKARSLCLLDVRLFSFVVQLPLIHSQFFSGF